MDDDVSYSTLVFSTSNTALPTKDTENVVYSEIRTTRENTSQSLAATEEVAAPRYTSYRKATAALGLLCVLLLAGLTTMCVLNIKEVSKYTSVLALYANESTAHRVLQADITALETERKELTAQRDQFKNTLRHIAQFLNFPVSKYCTSTNKDVHCKPCMVNWIQNGSNCYLLNMVGVWLTWNEAQQYCAERGGHLVVIDSVAEQEFLSQHIDKYFDRFHGYWIGLSKQYQKWIWINNAELQGNGFWSTPPENTGENCVLANPYSADVNNWRMNSCTMDNRCICEMKEMVWPSQM